MTGRPARANNQLAKTHGAYARVAENRLDRKAQEVFDAVAADAPVYEAPDGVAVRLLAETLCRLEDVQAYIAEHGVFDARRKKKAKNLRNRRGSPKTRPSRDPMRGLEMEDRLMKRAADMLDALGMTPRSRARLGVDLVRQRDLAKEWEDEDRAKRRRGSVEGTADDA